MARMMTMAVGNKKAHGELFNCVGDKGVTCAPPSANRLPAQFLRLLALCRAA